MSVDISAIGNTSLYSGTTQTAAIVSLRATAGAQQTSRPLLQQPPPLAPTTTPHDKQRNDNTHKSERDQIGSHEKTQQHTRDSTTALSSVQQVQQRQLGGPQQQGPQQQQQKQQHGDVMLAMKQAQQRPRSSEGMGDAEVR